MGRAANQYQARMGRVLRHIEEHLSEELSLDALSRIAAFSKFHFHRQFAAMHGISLHRYIQLRRFRRASYRLAFRTEAITEIALDSGYAAPEAFSRAFQQRFGQTPSEFRQQPDWMRWHSAFQPVDGMGITAMTQPFTPDAVRVATVGDRRVALLQHRGDPALIGDSLRRFIAWRQMAGLPPRLSATFNIWYDDPDSTPPAAFRLGLCAATDREIAPNDAGVTAATIPGGRCAVLRHVGPEPGLRRAVTWLYAAWLPGSGEELRDFPPYCQRVTFFPEVPEHEAITDIFLPLR